jgi:Trk K+ transport system NAD-binding subunit
MFISWVGPRGIVAAGIASVFGLKLTTEGVADAEMITPLVFLVVLGTVMLNATTARFVAKMLGVTLAKSNGIAIIGANQGSRLLANYLQKHERHVVLLDSSVQNIEAAKEEGLEAIKADIFADALNDNLDLVEMGYLFAMTGSHNVNTYAVENLQDTLGENGSYRFISSDEMNQENLEESEQNILFGQAFDFLKFSEIARTYPHIHEVEIKSDIDFHNYLDMMNEEQTSVPVFIKQGEVIHVLQLDRNAMNVAAGDVLVYLGKEIETQEETEA